MGSGQRKEKLDEIPTIDRTELVHDKSPKRYTLLSSQLEGYGYHHFKAVHVIANPAVLSDMPYRFFFRQFHVLVDGVYSPTNIAAEYIERIGYFLLCHPNGSSRHNDCPVFTDCNDSPVHVCIIFHCHNFVYIPFSNRCNCRI